MSLNAWLKAPGRRLLVMFYATTTVLVAALAWMSWQLVRQDAAIAGQRIQEQRDNAADLTVAALQKSFSQIQEQLTALSAAPAAEQPQRAARIADGLPGYSGLFLIRSGDIEALPAGRLLYYPNAAPPFAGTPANLTAAEEMEFRQDYAGAIAALRPLASLPDPALRAEALARLGRNLWKSGQTSEALAVYDQLAQCRDARVAGLPAELVAREARLLVLEERNDQSALRQEASALYSSLQSGGWRLDRDSYEFYVLEASRRLGKPPPEPPDTAPTSLAAEQAWQQWQGIREGESSPSGYRLCWQQDEPMLLIWRRLPDGIAALALDRTYLETQWLQPLQAALEDRGARVTLTDSDGRTVAGEPPGPGAQQSVRLTSATQLPWTLSAVSSPVAAPAAFTSRRRLVLTGLFTLILLVLAGSYFISRAATREIAVARLQSDFVASVSHEFRTPITALRQLTELLVNGRVESEEDRRDYYEALARESERLHRVVEGLLTFGRLESGALRLRFELVDTAEFLTSLVSEFEKNTEARGHTIELAANGAAPQVRADREALGCVIWNLLDNAVKYSPECPTVWVELRRDRDRAAIQVRDRGLGIPREERKQIFQKFVRGTAARERSIRGAGVGLAMAHQIVAAHGGDIVLESQPGQGSAFTVLLPEVSRK